MANNTKKDVAPIEADAVVSQVAESTVDAKPTPTTTVPVTTDSPAPANAAADSIINQPTAPSSPKPTAEPEMPATKDPLPATDTDKATPATEEKSLVIDDSEVKTDADQHERLGEEVEILTGEVQALEAKIDRLTGSIVESPLDNAVNKPVDEKKEVKPPEPVAAAPMPTPPSPPVTNNEPIISKPAEKITPPTPVKDIYPKLDLKTPAKTTDSEPLNTAVDDDSPSSLGMVGEVMGIIGIVIFIIMLLSPFYKEIIGTAAWDIVRSVGWITSFITIGIGFLLSLFIRGQWVLKIILFIFVLISALMYFGVNGNATITAQLDTYLGSVLSFYR